MTSVDDDLKRVAALVGTAEREVARLDTDPAAAWGMIATARLEVIELLEQLGQLPDEAERPPDTVQHPAHEQKDPAALYDEAAAVAASIDPAGTPRGLLVALVQALTETAAAARTVQHGHNAP